MNKARVTFVAVAALVSVATESFGDARSAVPDFSGFWSRATFGFEPPLSGPGPIRNLMRRADGTADARRVMGDYNNPILTPEGAAVIRKRGEISLSGNDYATPSNHCWPMVAPYIFRVQGMEVLQRKDRVTLIYMQDHQFREIRLNSEHPAQVHPSWHGDSVGHYEGDSLVVDTVGMKVSPVAMLDMYGTPFSETLHVTERYRLLSYENARQGQERGLKEFGPPATEQGAIIDREYRGPGIQVQFTVDDPKVFIRPWSGLATYLRAQGEWAENVCAENTREYYSGHDTDVPRAEKSDF